MSPQGAPDALEHYGVKRRSGRYPWGSGKHPFQRSKDFIARVDELKAQGLSEGEVAKALDMSTSDLRLQIRVANHERREVMRESAKSMQEDGKSLREIAKSLGMPNESSVRSLLNEKTASNKNKAWETADILEKEFKEKGFLDVGKGVETILGCSEGTLEEALFVLNTRGYEVYGVGVPQATNPKNQTTVTVLCAPGTTYSEAYAARNTGQIKSVGNYSSTDGGNTYKKLEYPASIDSKRVSVRYGDEGGSAKDGVIELRRGVADLDLGASHYAQVRILVDGTHYLKGMAMYSDDLPEGVDIVFNTNKKSGTPKMDPDPDKSQVLKPITKDPKNPFGAEIKANGQSRYIGKDGKEHLSVINKLKEEGDWEKMSRTLSSQFLSKQPIKFIKSQLDLTYKDYESQFEEIMSLNNPTVKKKMLKDFADGCDSEAQELKAAALPRQTTQVILPLSHIKEDEVFAPNYKNGEKLALVRFPHGGTFEIPIVTVNNRNASGINNIGLNVKDAIGIHPKVAERLSGADFDGDQVIAIPTHNGRVKIQTRDELGDLKGFNPKDAYPPQKDSRRMKKGDETQNEMGKISNLITDMTLKGADDKELARAVKHSMVVIDAAKHGLDFKKSERDNGIAELKSIYQGYVVDGKDYGGASTLLSRRNQDIRIPETKGSAKIDPDTGKLVYKQSGRTYIDKKGKEVRATTKSKLLKETDDLHALSSGTLPEEAYADFGNKLKSLANRARKEYLQTPNLSYNKGAALKYKEEVASLNASLNEFLKNAPRERQAQLTSYADVKTKVDADPNLKNDKKELKKVRNISISNARAEVGASSKNVKIQISDKEWEAIQAGAISHTKLGKILDHADGDRVKELALPKTTTQLPEFKVTKLQAMLASGNYTNSEIAESLGCSVSTVSRYAAK